MASTKGTKLYATLVNGKTAVLKLGADGAFPDKAALKKAGIGNEAVSFSMDKPSPAKKSKKKKPKLLIATSNKQILSEHGITTPELPVPESPTQLPPAVSDSLLQSHDRYYPNGVGKKPFFVKMKANNNYWPAYSKADKKRKGAGWVSDPKFTKPMYVNFYVYWQQVKPLIIDGPTQYKRTVATSVGMSKSETSTLSAELGVNIQGLSAKVSASVSKTVAISKTESVSEEFTVAVPEGKTAVWILWQLVERFEMADEDGNPIEWKGTIQSSKKKFSRYDALLKSNTFENLSNITRPQITYFDKQ